VRTDTDQSKANIPTQASCTKPTSVGEVGALVSGTETATPSTRVPELDGLRGLAILMVILFHYVASVPHGSPQTLSSKLSQMLVLGASGVDLFFILSGFLIGGILLNSRKSERYFQTFYLRRFHRIVPVYYLWILLFPVVGFAATRWMHVSAGSFATLFPLPIYFLFLQNYFPTQLALQYYWFGPAWSLGVEEQFYLVTPPLIRYISVRKLSYVLGTFVLLGPVLRYATIHWAAHGIIACYKWMPNRADELALGMLAAIVSSSAAGRDWLHRHIHSLYVALVIGGLLLLVQMKTFFAPVSVSAETLGRSTEGLFYLFLMLTVLNDRAGLLAAIFRWSWLRKLGTISYCVYLIHIAMDGLCHYLLFHRLPQVGNWQGFSATLLAFGLTIALADLSWVAFEKPLVRRGHSWGY
jgi:peptidoglycan/LPS O-acetylase OafA/YrhL